MAYSRSSWAPANLVVQRFIYVDACEIARIIAGLSTLTAGCQNRGNMKENVSLIAYSPSNYLANFILTHSFQRLQLNVEISRYLGASAI
jgi:hypothetical protein